ncbi:hypothetical protein D3C72_2018420 [compost metagenome]
MACGCHAHALAHVGAQGAGRARKGGRYEPRIGVTVVWTKRAARDVPAQPAETLSQCPAVQHFQVHAKASGALAVGLQRGQVRFRAGQLEMA